MKLPNNEKAGIVQAVNYLTWINRRLLQDASKNRVGLFTDFLEISVFSFHDGKFEKGSLFLSDLLPLFPPKWRDLTEPTEGFKLLCHALMVPLPIEVQTIDVGRRCCRIVATIFSSSECMVYLVKPSFGESFVVKVATENNRYARGLLQSEHEKLLDLHKHPELVPYLAGLVDGEVTNGFAMQKGTSLEVELMQIGTENEPATVAQVCAFLKPLLLNAFDGIRQLHAIGWFHGDIRPTNLLVINGTLRLIDFMTSGPYDSRKYMVRSGYEDPFCVCGDKASSEFLFHWDLYGLAYSMIFLVSPRQDRELFCEENKR